MLDAASDSDLDFFGWLASTHMPLAISAALALLRQICGLHSRLWPQNCGLVYSRSLSQPLRAGASQDAVYKQHSESRASRPRCASVASERAEASSRLT